MRKKLHVALHVAVIFQYMRKSEIFAELSNMEVLKFTTA